MTATADARLAQNLDGMFFEGDVLIRAKDAAGNWGKIIGPISPVKLALNPGSSTTVSRKLRLRGQWGQVANSVASEAAEPTVAFETDDAGSELILLAMRASTEAVSETGSSVSDGVTAVPFLGSWLQLPHRNIAVTGFSGKHANDSALTAGTDYVLQDIWTQYGLIWIPATSSIAVDEACKWTYTYGTVTGTKITGNALSQVSLKLEMFGTNRTDSSAMHLKVHEIVVSEGADLDFAATDFFKPNFSGKMVTPAGEAGPYFMEPLAFA